ncbi:MAG TPA: DegT/DnrJ/EryC1/StrS family aminotransferase, partial [Planctomycetota bacterium]|nr:DegT/DnrJ/EryC1/StrS family aminotransferase [Planctomycetota bacterium]
MSAPARWPFCDLRAGFLAQREELLAAAARVLDSGHYVLGAEVEAFEREFAQWLGGTHVVGVANATDALELALRAFDVGPGDEVVIPSLTAAPTAMAVLATGAMPVLADIDAAWFTLDPTSLRACLSMRTAAIIPVHLYGQCADMDAIRHVAETAGVPILEDCAQSHGATFHGQRAGSFGAAAAFSFYPTKNLGAFGDGGALATPDRHLAERLARLRFYGGIAGYDFTEPGRNSRLDELQAALLRVRLGAVAAGNERRRLHARRYREGLRDAPVELPAERGGSEHVYHQFVVRTPARDRLRDHLAARGIETQIYYPE